METRRTIIRPTSGWRTGASFSLVITMLAAAADQKQPDLNLTPIVTIRQAGDRFQMASLRDVQERQGKPLIFATNFLAVITDRWPIGLVPVFAVERENGRFELRRLPPRGMENGTDPLFFALPREDERQATDIAGTWTCTATNAEGSQHWVVWELAADGSRVAGRFDQQTEYRFASVTGGTFASNRFELMVEHIQDRFVVLGNWRDGTMAGTWRQEEGPQRGTWGASRHRKGNVPPASGTTELYEWKMTGEDERRYLLSGDNPGKGWERANSPLCRVWRVR